MNRPALSPKLTSSHRATEPASEADTSAKVSTVNGRTSRRPSRANCTQWSVRFIRTPWRSFRLNMRKALGNSDPRLSTGVGTAPGLLNRGGQSSKGERRVQVVERGAVLREGGGGEGRCHGERGPQGPVVMEGRVVIEDDRLPDDRTVDGGRDAREGD